MIERMAWAPVAAMLLAAGASGEPYRLQRGDVLRVVVAGVADLDERAVVDVDGLVRVPLGGAIPAAGRTIDEVAEALRQAIAGKALQVMGDGGQAVSVQVPPDAVSVAVDAYQPVYVGGDVRSPGAFDYVPGLTARRALALAGGLGRTSGDPVLLAAEIEEELGVIRARVEAARRRADRLRAILDDPMAREAAEAEGAPGRDAGTLDAVEAARLRLARRDLRANLAQTEEERGTARARLDALEQQLAFEEEGARADEADFERLRTLREGGQVTADRLSDARRGMLLSSTRRLEVDAELAQAEREVQRLEHQAETLPDEVAAAALAALSDELATIDELDARRRGLEAKLAYAGRAGSALEALFDLDLRVVRDGEETVVPPDGDVALMPGDLLTIAMTRLDGASDALLAPDAAPGAAPVPGGGRAAD